jgi:putative FmdB family regulatory protein
MPTYDYRCTACGHKFELLQSIKAEPEKVCPACGGEVKREIGPGAGFIFKGSGFYITDYARSKDYQEKSKSESKPSGSEAASGGGGKKESGAEKPAEAAKPAAATSSEGKPA